MSKWRRIVVDATSSRRIDVSTTSFLGYLSAGKFIDNILICQMDLSEFKRWTSPKQKLVGVTNSWN